MFQYMVDENGLRREMEKYDLIPDQDIPFIKELIKGVDASAKTVISHHVYSFLHIFCFLLLFSLLLSFIKGKMPETFKYLFYVAVAKGQGTARKQVLLV